MGLAKPSTDEARRKTPGNCRAGCSSRKNAGPVFYSPGSGNIIDFSQECGAIGVAARHSARFFVVGPPLPEPSPKPHFARLDSRRTDRLHCGGQCSLLPKLDNILFICGCPPSPGSWSTVVTSEERGNQMARDRVVTSAAAYVFCRALVAGLGDRPCRFQSGSADFVAR